MFVRRPGNASCDGVELGARVRGAVPSDSLLNALKVSDCTACANTVRYEYEAEGWGGNEERTTRRG